MITIEEAEFLFKAARSSLNGKKVSEKIPEILHEKAGIFVTLYTYPRHELRGCVGYFEPLHSVMKGVEESSKSAAFDDNRFKPLTPEEFDDVTFEISILSKPLPCKSEEINEGDGVVLTKNGKQAVFLPQVWHHFPIKKEFLDQLCLKAGLTFDDWKDASFLRFNVISFEEDEPNGKIKKN